MALEGTVIVLMGCALTIYALGLYLLISQRHFIKKIIALEMLVGAVNLNVIAMGLHISGNITQIDPFVGVIIILATAIGGLIAAVAFALAYWTRLHFDTLNVDSLSTLKR